MKRLLVLLLCLAMLACVPTPEEEFVVNKGNQSEMIETSRSEDAAPDADLRLLYHIPERMTGSYTSADGTVRVTVDAELVGYHTGYASDLHGVVKNVLPVARAVTEPSEQPDEIVVHASYTEVEHGLLSGLFYYRLNFPATLFNRLLDFRRMNAPVRNELFKSHSRDLAPDGVEA